MQCNLLGRPFQLPQHFRVLIQILEKPLWRDRFCANIGYRGIFKKILYLLAFYESNCCTQRGRKERILCQLSCRYFLLLAASLSLLLHQQMTWRGRNIKNMQGTCYRCNKEANNGEFYQEFATKQTNKSKIAYIRRFIFLGFLSKTFKYAD